MEIREIYENHPWKNWNVKTYNVYLDSSPFVAYLGPKFGPMQKSIFYFQLIRKNSQFGNFEK